MIYGYDSRPVDEHGLKQMREIHLALRPHELRALSEFLADAATELEGAASAAWHLHAPDELSRSLGGSVIVFASKHEHRN
jgi:hypothetical protein